MARAPVVAMSLAALLLGSAPAGAATDRDDWRPPALEPSAACDVYAGTSSGNDPTNIVELRVCTTGTAVTGQAQYSGKLSGWNRRDFAGAWSEDGRVLTLRELAIVEQKPNPGWRFCTIERYVLARQPGTKALVGTYDSAACQDHARLSLSLTASGVPAAREDPPPARPAVPVDPSLPPPRRSCSCRQAGGTEGGATGAVLAALALCACGRRGRRSRRHERSSSPRP